MVLSITDCTIIPAVPANCKSFAVLASCTHNWKSFWTRRRKLDSTHIAFDNINDIVSTTNVSCFFPACQCWSQLPAFVGKFTLDLCSSPRLAARWSTCRWSGYRGNNLAWIHCFRPFLLRSSQYSLRPSPYSLYPSRDPSSKSKVLSHFLLSRPSTSSTRRRALSPQPEHRRWASFLRPKTSVLLRQTLGQQKSSNRHKST